jgi:DNA-binding response OmpR family regulator
MSSEVILIIKQFRETDINSCQVALESSPEKYSVVVASNYQEGQRLLKVQPATTAERLSAVLIDTEEVDTYTLELLTNLRGLKDCPPLIVMTRLADNSIRHALTSRSAECLIKIGQYDKYLWKTVKNSLLRNPNQPQQTRIRSNKSYGSLASRKKMI